jgi:hypothetical protein
VEDADREIVTIHFHGGTKAVATIDKTDLADEQFRIEEINDQRGTEFNDRDRLRRGARRVGDSPVPPKPGWRWIGDAFVFTQAVSGSSTGRTLMTTFTIVYKSGAKVQRQGQVPERSNGSPQDDRLGGTCRRVRCCSASMRSPRSSRGRSDGDYRHRGQHPREQSTAGTGSTPGVRQELPAVIFEAVAQLARKHHVDPPLDHP